MTKIIRTSSGTLLRNSGRLLVCTPGAAAQPTEPAPTDNGSGVVSMTAFSADRIFQRVGTSKSVPVVGTVTGADGVVEMRVVDATGAAVTSWVAVGTSSSGAFSGELSVPQGGWCKRQARKATNPGAVTTDSGNFAVGEWVVLAGQSNMEHLWTSNRQTYPSYPLSSSKVRGIQVGKAGGYGRIGNSNDAFPPGAPFGGAGGYSTYTGGTTDGGDGMVYFANQLTAALGVPVGVVMAAVGGTAIESWQPGQARWNAMIALLDAVGGDCGTFLWYQGENNGGNTAAAYGAMITPIHQGMLTKTGRTTSSFAFGMVTLGPTGNYGAEGTAGPIREAQVAYLANAGVFLAAVAGDSSSPSGDQVHIDNDSQIRLGHRYAKSIAAYHAGAPKPGPRITGATRSGAVITVSVAGGTGALKDGAGGPGGSLKGFRVFVNGVDTAISSTAISGSTAVLTLPSAPSGTVTLDYGMANLPYGVVAPLPANVLYDSDTVTYANANIPGVIVGLPLRPCAAITVTGG